MSLLLGDTAPDFEADTTEGRIRFHDWIGEDWVVFFSHPADFTWISDIEETQNATVDFPLIGDPEKEVATLYNMIHPNADAKVTVRAVYVIDPNKKIRASVIYPPSAGRNFDEILRVIDSMQLTDNFKVATPVNWKDGEDVIIVPGVTDPDEIARLFPKGHKEIKPYLRTTPQPNK